MACKLVLFQFARHIVGANRAKGPGDRMELKNNFLFIFLSFFLPFSLFAFVRFVKLRGAIVRWSTSYENTIIKNSNNISSNALHNALCIKNYVSSLNKIK